MEDEWSALHLDKPLAAFALLLGIKFTRRQNNRPDFGSWRFAPGTSVVIITGREFHLIQWAGSRYRIGTSFRFPLGSQIKLARYYSSDPTTQGPPCESQQQHLSGTEKVWVSSDATDRKYHAFHRDRDNR